MNQFILVGRIVEKPILQLTSVNIKYTFLSLAVKRNFKNADGVYERDIFQITLWRGIAEEVIDTCDKDTLLAIRGRVITSFYTSEENKTYTNYEFVAERVQYLEV
ncbi:single-stranded DNA-binding protein [Breznakia blatticola]|uniref:Single-stranded DNA-binding protein n=1 Tax=Breznakia blatticola TaxID=1754012 RepID=A0A4R7Z8U0_9FIRM|nr:single-stranded DNA-binding protein [Breznakia blatticola]TDW13102.1 single-stranded DNA-binding protein [Breznakia blatticola]